MQPQESERKMRQNENDKKMPQHNFTPPKKRVPVNNSSENFVLTRSSTPKRRICTLPKNSYKNSDFQPIFNAIIDGNFTVAGWLKVRENRLRLANVLAGQMNTEMLEALCAGDKEIRTRWAQKLNRQLRQYKENQAQHNKKIILKAALGNSLPMKQEYLDHSLIRQLISQLRALDESHQVAPSSHAWHYKRIAWGLINAMNPQLKVDSAPRPQDSLVWVLKGHIFDSFVINKVSKIIRSLGKGEICWSNFSLGVDREKSTYAQLDIRADDKHLLAEARIRLLKLFKGSKNLQYGPPGSPGLVVFQRNTNRNVESKTQDAVLFKIVGHLVDRCIINQVVHVLKGNPECTARIKSLEIRGEKDTAIIELEGDAFVCETMVNACLKVLRDCDANFDSDPAHEARIFKLSEEDVKRTVRSYTLEKFELEPEIPVSVSPFSLYSGSCGASAVDSVNSLQYANSAANRVTPDSSPEPNSPPPSPTRHHTCRRLDFLSKAHSHHRPQSPPKFSSQYHSHSHPRSQSCSHLPLKSRPRIHSPTRASSHSSVRFASFREREMTATPSSSLRVRALLASVNGTSNDEPDMRKAFNETMKDVY